ncbi:hypothetical protein Anas_06510 [Armadillidium nasatum]|uniref:Uncharacterized protein n=1 Tax=Armadillidium nasatum TaxID=96803 RepID=A0A5N5STD1_9CRUS|nr:hypothetical protein Anas_06510 [Armadillidium nasatum]
MVGRMLESNFQTYDDTDLLQDIFGLCTPPFHSKTGIIFRMVNVLENISQELYHLIIQQKNMSRTVSATEVQEEMDIEKAELCTYVCRVLIFKARDIKVTDKINTFKLDNKHCLTDESNDIFGIITDLCLELEGLQKCIHNLNLSVVEHNMK